MPEAAEIRRPPTMPRPDSPHPFRSDAARDRYLARYGRRERQWPVSGETRSVPTSFGPTLVRTSGPVGGPPLVLLHGIGGSSLLWEPNIAALADRYRTHAVDAIYDFGLSVPTRLPRTPDDLVTWLDDLLTGLDPIEPPVLVGLSYGGWVAARYALAWPHRIRALVAIAPAATVHRISRSWTLRAMACFLPHPRFCRSFMRYILADLVAGGPAGRRVADDWADDTYAALRSFKPRPPVPPDVFSDRDLRRLKDPTLVILGETEKLYPPAAVLKRLHRAAPHVRTALIPGAGHDVTFVRPEAVHREVVGVIEGS
jgi:pimeloyl-ACP methyl ester carboxylesterase